ncbi:CIC11C00000005281 [Sungouiella intermedia]|uniref:Endoplasmic reticulum lectin n=1 Tax=Sungouiella intermedia TaxID=45354 RepID=A0A1L0BA47_9ASCO|nr:CIC11C00000005281 [[Candida] intermedia]
MKPFNIFVASLLASRLGAAQIVNVPLNFRIQDTEIPQELAANLVSSPKSSQSSQLTSKTRFERLFIHRNNDSEEYLCAIPPANSTFQDMPEESQLDLEKDSIILARAIDIVHGSFSPDQCVWSYDLRGFYWTYGYCHGDKIVQYHEMAPMKDRPHKHVPGSPNMVYVLGRFSKASAKEVSFKNQVSAIEMQKYIRDSGRSFRLVDEKLSPFSHLSQKVVLQMASDGSLCDMTLHPRSTEVVYKCDVNGGKHPQILDVEEIKTCHYRLFVHVPGLCQYEPFLPNKDTEDLVDVTCQRVSSQAAYSVDGMLTFEDYSHHHQLRKDSPFPVPADTRINVAMHDMVALSRGFYLAKYTGEYGTSSEYYNHRNVILFNGFHTSLDDLNLQLGRTVFNSIGKNLLAPLFKANEQVMLSWTHSFIMWFEVYNFKGELLGISRLLHDGSNEVNVLGAQMFDPVTLLDVDGDDSMPRSFNRPAFEAPYNMWNFEMFLAKGRSPAFNKKGRSTSKKSQSWKKKLEEDMVELTQMVLVYNDGVMADGSPNIEIYLEDTGEKLTGQYNEKDVYEFTYEPNPGQTETFTALVIPEVEYFGYPITFREPKSLAELKKLEELTVTVTQTAGTAEATDQGAELQDERDDVNDGDDANNKELDREITPEHLFDELIQRLYDNIDGDVNHEHLDEFIDASREQDLELEDLHDEL